MDTLEEFYAKWCSHYEAEPVNEQQLQTAERRLGIQLPTSYRNSILTHGISAVDIELLGSIVEPEIDLQVVAEFFPPKDICERTETWRPLGLPSDLIAFADDHSGNLFCFKFPTSTEKPDAVWFYDHDFEETELAAPSFEEWLQDYCAIERLECID